MIPAGLRIGLVGPLPPPAGGMANQTLQLAELLRGEGADVTIVQANAPYAPPWVSNVRGVRALFRLVPYLARLWRVAGSADLIHVMANSGWSWHLIAAPAIRIARLRGVPTIVNYRGGEAAAFLARSGASIRRTLRRASVLVVPSGFLHDVFGRCGIASEVVPNIIDIERFRPAAARAGAPHLVVARNLEPIYDIPTALRAFAQVRKHLPDARMTVAGSGPALQALEAQCATLGVADAVAFCGRLDRGEMAELYRRASVVLNPSSVDNMPNSVLEAMASGVPVVSTNVGGVPYILRDGDTGLLVNAGDHEAMAMAVLRVHGDDALAARIRAAALADVQQYTWPRVREQWAGIYSAAGPRAGCEANAA